MNTLNVSPQNAVFTHWPSTSIASVNRQIQYVPWVVKDSIGLH